MQQDYEHLYHTFERDQAYQWWFASHHHALSILLSSIPRSAPLVELGCSGGNILAQLQSAGFTNVLGIDKSPDAIAACKERGLTNVKKAQAEAVGLPSKSIKVIIAIDLLEHIPDEATALQEWRRILEPGGFLILFVPAFMLLWSAHDVDNHHIRRYRRKELTTLLKNHGFTIEQSSYWNFLLFFPTACVRILGRLIPPFLKPAAKPAHAPPFLNGIITRLLYLENYLLFKKGMRYPVGVSLFVLAKKSKDNDSWDEV